MTLSVIPAIHAFDPAGAQDILGTETQHRCKGFAPVEIDNIQNRQISVSRSRGALCQ